MDFSIIVPVYNAENHLVRCLSSILKQDFIGEFEVIAVDDCSSDNSLEILRNNQGGHPNFAILQHSKNEGVGVARTTGLKEARGQYVMQVDSDDWLMPGALSAVYAAIQGEPVDVVMFNHARVDGQGACEIVTLFNEQDVVEPTMRILPHFYKSCWNKVVKRSMLEKMVYHHTSLRHSEDLIFGIEVFLRAKTVMLLPGVHYAYYHNAASITQTKTREDWIRSRVAVLEALVKVEEAYEHADPVVLEGARHQAKGLQKALAISKLNPNGGVDLTEVLRLLKLLDHSGTLSVDLSRSASSVFRRVANLYRYWGINLAASYVLNGLLLPRVGYGWRQTRDPAD